MTEFKKAKFSKVDFLEDMIATDDKNFSEWLIVESKRIVRNRFLVYGVSCLYFSAFLVFILLDAFGFFEVGEVDYVLLGANFGTYFLTIIVSFIAITYSLSRLTNTNSLRKKRIEMLEIYDSRYIKKTSSSYPVTTPELLNNESGQFARIALRAENKQDALTEIKNSNASYVASPFLALFFLWIASLFSGFIWLFILYVIYNWHTSKVKKKDTGRANDLLNEKFGTE